MTQNDLATSAQVSRRWLSDLEAGKPTAEIGLIFKLLHALEVTLEVSSAKTGPADFELDGIIRAQGQFDSEATTRG